MTMNQVIRALSLRASILELLIGYSIVSILTYVGKGMTGDLCVSQKMNKILYNLSAMEVDSKLL